jgi:uncharacterized protein YndB with AHSA1/START domain
MPLPVPPPERPALKLRRIVLSTLALAAALAAPAARAELSGVSPTGFVVTHRKDVAAPPDRVFDAIGDIARWWNPQHTYSGNAANLKLDMAAGGCFCERWDGNSIVHADVIYVSRGKAVRLQGGLGPLQPLAVVGVLTIAVDTVDGRTVMSWTYRVSGPADAELQKWATPVDQVIGEQATRLAALAGGAKP